MVRKINIGGVTVECRCEAPGKWEAKMVRSYDNGAGPLTLRRCGKTAEDAALAIERDLGLLRVSMFWPELRI